MSKVCPICHREFLKRKTISKKFWEKQVYCSIPCVNTIKANRGKVRRQAKLSEIKEVVCRCGCGTKFSRRVYKKGSSGYIAQSVYFYDQSHFKDYQYRITGMRYLLSLARQRMRNV